MSLNSLFGDAISLAVQILWEEIGWKDVHVDMGDFNAPVHHLHVLDPSGE